MHPIFLFVFLSERDFVCVFSAKKWARNRSKTRGKIEQNAMYGKVRSLPYGAINLPYIF
jgi:hypothetical protein